VRKRWWLIPLAIVLMLTGALFPLLSPRPSRVTKANFGRIEMGMSRSEVEALLGGPPGDYRTLPATVSTATTWNAALVAGTEESWLGDEGNVVIYFDAGGVRSFRFEAAEPTPITPIGLALWRLNRLKNRWFP
jgi:hypothetical protein